MKNEMGKKTTKSWSGDRTWHSRTSMFNDLRLRPFDHDISHAHMVLIVGIETVRAL